MQLKNYTLYNKSVNYDILFYYNIGFIEKHIKNQYMINFIHPYVNYNLFNKFYSSTDIVIFKQFLINLKNNNENNNISIPKTKYDFVSCHSGYIYGLSLSASYKLMLHIPQFISTIAMSLKLIEKNGTLLLFWSIINVNIPIIKKIFSILSYGFKNIEIINNDINQNFFIGVPEYYIKCEGYKDNISNNLINNLIDIAIETIDYSYDKCDILDYYEDYTKKNPNHSLFYNKQDDNQKLSKTRNINKTLKSSSFQKLSKSSSHKSSKSLKPITPIYYIEDINIPELDEIMKDSTLQFNVSLLMNKLEGIFVGYFEMVNNLILNSIDTDKHGKMFVKPEAILKKDITNLTKLINMFEVNKLPYNKHALQIVLQKKDEYSDYLYSLNNNINTTLVKHHDRETVYLNNNALDKFALSKPYSIDIYNNYIDSINIATKVKSKIIEDIKDYEEVHNLIQDEHKHELEELDNQHNILDSLCKGLTTYIKLNTKNDKIPVTIKDFILLAKQIKSRMGISMGSEKYKVGFIVRKNNRILYDYEAKLKRNKHLFVHDILTDECKKLNIPFKIGNFDNATFEEQAEFLKDVKILIACHGAAFTNLFLLPPGATIFEVSFRKYWYCDPVCVCHSSGECPYKKDCHNRNNNINTGRIDPNTGKLIYHKADYYNLSQLFGVGYKEILLEDADGYFKNPEEKDYNPISLTNLYIDTNQLMEKIKKAY